MEYEYATKLIVSCFTNPIRIVWLCVCVYACAHTVKTLLNKNLWRHYSLCSFFLFQSLVVVFFSFYLCVYLSLKLNFPKTKTIFSLSLYWNNETRQTIYTQTHANTKKLKTNEKIWHTFVLLFRYKQTSCSYEKNKIKKEW